MIQEHIRYVRLKGGCRYVEGRPDIHRGGLMRGSDMERIGYVLLPDAAYPTDAVLRRLQADNYSGFVTLEPHVPADFVTAFYDREIPFVRSFLPAAQNKRECGGRLHLPPRYML